MKERREQVAPCMLGSAGSRAAGAVPESYHHEVDDSTFPDAAGDVRSGQASPDSPAVARLNDASGNVESSSAIPRIEIHITPPTDVIERAAGLFTCAAHGLWLCNLCGRADGGVGP